MTLHISGCPEPDASASAPGTPSLDGRCCLLLHGFTGGPYEVMPLAEHLREQGFHCHVPTLPGHDQGLKGLGDVTWRDWLRAAAREADRLARQFGEIEVVGFSMGGLLSAYLPTASQYAGWCCLMPRRFTSARTCLFAIWPAASAAGTWSQCTVLNIRLFLQPFNLRSWLVIRSCVSCRGLRYRR